MLLVISFLLLLVPLTSAGKKDKPHAHQGILKAYDGKHIPYSISEEQNKKLEAGEAVTSYERSGSSGRGYVIADIKAPPAVCMDRIRDISNYPKMVPKVNSVKIYSDETFKNGTIQQGGYFKVGISLITFEYFLKLTYEPKYNTYTWTLDYGHTSDFEDNVGHWQVIPHPTKEGWTRLLYSCEVKLYSWVPEFVVTFLTKTALVEATQWVTKESEKAVKNGKSAKDFAALQLPDVKACFVNDKKKYRYSPRCSLGQKPPRGDEL